MQLVWKIGKIVCWPPWRVCAPPTGNSAMLNVFEIFILDVDECKINNGGCSDECTNTQGSYFCECPDGAKLGRNNLTCIGKDP